MNTNVKLNVGCGSDYKDGFINIDASNSLNRVDKIIDLEKESLLKQFLPESCGFILANDIVEHLYHWQAVQLLTDFYTLLASGGSLEVRVPDTEYIIKSWSIPLRQKVFYLYGGQDIPQGGSVDMEKSREKILIFSAISMDGLDLVFMMFCQTSAFSLLNSNVSVLI